MHDTSPPDRRAPSREDVEEKSPPRAFHPGRMGVSIAACVAGGVVLGSIWSTRSRTTRRCSPWSVCVVGVVFAVTTAYVEIKRFL